MNQQLIDKLLHKAGAYFGAEGTDYSDFSSSKFAELIVRECIAQCEKNVDHEYLGWGSKLSSFNIKQHFGVEE